MAGRLPASSAALTLVGDVLVPIAAEQEKDALGGLDFGNQRVPEFGVGNGNIVAVALELLLELKAVVGHVRGGLRYVDFDLIVAQADEDFGYTLCGAADLGVKLLRSRQILGTILREEIDPMEFFVEQVVPVIKRGGFDDLQKALRGAKRLGAGALFEAFTPGAEIERRADGNERRSVVDGIVNALDPIFAEAQVLGVLPEFGPPTERRVELLFDAGAKGLDPFGLIASVA